SASFLLIVVNFFICLLLHSFLILCCSGVKCLSISLSFSLLIATTWPNGVSCISPANKVQNSPQDISGSFLNLIPYWAVNDASIRSQSSYRSYHVSAFCLFAKPTLRYFVLLPHYSSHNCNHYLFICGYG